MLPRTIDVAALVIHLTAGPTVLAAHAQSATADTTRQVWVNTKSGVFHCPGTRFWHQTKAGILLAEAEALSRGYRPAGGKSCGLAATSVDSSALRLQAKLRPALLASSARVWVNPASGVYHCPGAPAYGSTKAGRFVPEIEAKNAGFRPAGSKECSPPATPGRPSPPG